MRHRDRNKVNGVVKYAALFHIPTTKKRLISMSDVAEVVRHCFDCSEMTDRNALLYASRNFNDFSIYLKCNYTQKQTSNI